MAQKELNSCHCATGHAVNGCRYHKTGACTKFSGLDKYALPNPVQLERRGLWDTLLQKQNSVPIELLKQWVEQVKEL